MWQDWRCQTHMPTSANQVTFTADRNYNKVIATLLNWTIIQSVLDDLRKCIVRTVVDERRIVLDGYRSDVEAAVIDIYESECEIRCSLKKAKVNH